MEKKDKKEHFVHKSLLAVLAAVLLLGGVFSYVAHKRANEADNISPVVRPTPKTPTSLPDVVFPSEVKTNSIKKTAFPMEGETGANFVEAEGKYPTNTPFADRAEKHVKDFIASFMKEYPEPDAINMGMSAGVSAQSSPEVFRGKKLVSYMYQDWRDDGGAHGNASYSSETFDMNGKTYALGDLFLPGTGYLSVLSRLSTEYFKNDPDIAFDPKDKTFGGGLAPVSDNFKAFAVSGDSLIFRFQNYQIAPYAAGAPTFEISIFDQGIKPLLRPELFGW